jgi:hypothetical protein
MYLIRQDLSGVDLYRELDPPGYEEENKRAPTEWSFCSAKDLGEVEPADWWKTPWTVAPGEGPALHDSAERERDK